MFFSEERLGYNNGVYALNAMCNYLYSNESSGIIARCLNVEDIESHLSVVGENEKNTYISGNVSGLSANSYIESVNTTNNTVTYKNAYSYYPLLYAKQNGSGINTTQIKTNGISESDSYYSTPTAETSAQATNLTVQQTYYDVYEEPSFFYDYDGSNSNFYKALFETGTYYWVASRYSNCNNTDCELRLALC